MDRAGTSAGRPILTAAASQIGKDPTWELSKPIARYHGRPRACSSVDRASASGAEGRRFESCRARQEPLV